MKIDTDQLKELIYGLQKAAGCYDYCERTPLTDCQDISLHGGRCASWKQRPLTLEEEEFLWEGEETDHD